MVDDATRIRPRPRYVRAAAARLAAAILTPSVHRWILRQEERIRRQGRPLTRAELALARAVGLKDSGRVRILVVARIPLPFGWLQQRIARFSGVVLANPVALTAGHGIYICRSHQDQRVVVRHELVHVHQYERLGRRAFLLQYIRDCLLEGYRDSALEKEARRLSVSAGRD